MAPNSCWRSEFTLFEQSQTSQQHQLCYLDSAATSLVPKTVAEAITHYHQFQHANSHRGFYRLAAELTENIEQIRANVKQFLGANDKDHLIFTSGTTESIQQVALGYVQPQLTPDKNIVISIAEHHANWLIWQKLCQDSGAQLRIVGITESGAIDTHELARLTDNNTVIVALHWLSNVIGVENPIAEIAQIVHQAGSKLLIDGAQGAAFLPANFTDSGADFFAFSGHKMYAGSGIGGLVAKEGLLAQMTPFKLGGGIVQQVTRDSYRLRNDEIAFEAGTHHSAGIIGLNAAIKFLQQIGWQHISKHHHQLSSAMVEHIKQADWFVPLFGDKYKPSKNQHLFSFNLSGVHSHDVASMLDQNNIAVRAGHHCAQPLHQQLNIKSSVRISFGLYNQIDDIERVFESLNRCHKLMSLTT